MAFCGNCGKQHQDGLNFCPSCGQAVNVTVEQNVQQEQQAPVYQQPEQNSGQSEPKSSPINDAKDAQDNKLMAVLAYLLFFIPLLTGAHKTSPFAKYHTNQGTVLFITLAGLSIALGLVVTIFSAIFSAIFAWGLVVALAGIFGFVWVVYGIGSLVLVIIGILNAANGKMKPLPIIGKFTIIK